MYWIKGKKAQRKFETFGELLQNDGHIGDDVDKKEESKQGHHWRKIAQIFRHQRLAREEASHPHLRKKAGAITLNVGDNVEGYGWQKRTHQAENFRNLRMPVFTIPKTEMFKPSKAADDCEGHQHNTQHVCTDSNKNTREKVAVGQLLTKIWIDELDDDTNTGMDVQDLIVKREERIHEVDGIVLTGWACVVIILENTVQEVTDNEAENKKDD